MLYFQEFECILSRLRLLNKLATDRPMCDPGYCNGICNKCSVGQQWLDDSLDLLPDWMTRRSAVGPNCHHTLALKKSFSMVTLHTTSRTDTVLFETDKQIRKECCVGDETCSY